MITLEITSTTSDHGNEGLTSDQMRELVIAKGRDIEIEPYRQAGIFKGWMKHDPLTGNAYDFKTLKAAKGSTRKWWNDTNEYVALYMELPDGRFCVSVAHLTGEG